MLKAIGVGLLVIFALLEYRFWIGKDSVIKVAHAKNNLRMQELELQKLTQRNQDLMQKISDLKAHPINIEEQARYELGMVRKGENYYQVVEPIE